MTILHTLKNIHKISNFFDIESSLRAHVLFLIYSLTCNISSYICFLDSSEQLIILQHRPHNILKLTFYTLNKDNFNSITFYVICFYDIVTTRTLKTFYRFNWTFFYIYQYLLYKFRAFNTLKQS